MTKSLNQDYHFGQQQQQQQQQNKVVFIVSLINFKCKLKQNIANIANLSSPCEVVF